MDSEKKALYIESTIPSYATGNPSGDIITAGKQALTKLFWEQQQDSYEVVTSEYTLAECKRGDPEAAKKRLDWLAGIPVLYETEEIVRLAAIYQGLLKIPDKASADCSHLAVCVFNRIDYLVTWNCKHLGFVSYTKAKVYNDAHGLWTPILVTPEALTDIAEE
jgi:predicted nucleic acid-binding protein